MNNSDVLRMVRGTTPISVILERINRSDPDFTLFPGDIRRLREQHVPDSVIDAMMARNQGKNVDSPVQNTGCSAPLPGKPRTPGQPALIVNDSTPVRLRLLNNLSSAYLHLDDRVDFEVLQDVSPQIDSAGPHFLVIPREALAYGTVTAVNPTKVLGRYGSVEVALDHVCLANGDKIALRDTEKGDRHIRPGILVFLLVPVGYVVQPKDPVWLTPLGRASMIKDGRDFTVFDGVADLDSSQFEQRNMSTLLRHLEA
jgi:hypothetical protein